MLLGHAGRPLVARPRRHLKADVDIDAGTTRARPTFDVPGVGASTLHSPRGLAVDDEHVYVVDAGPDLGEPSSNQWFKFTRDGTPVSSSALTDLVDHLDFGLDSVLDGIHRIPDDAPYGAGLFLVAVEHSGFLVLDEDGFFVDRLSWDEADLPPGVIPFAFSGITMDPLRGDLCLVENSGSRCHVWTRLPLDPVAVLYLPVGSAIEVRTPADACTRMLGFDLPADPIFGMAYQASSGLLWSVAYNTGEVYAVDPRSGLSANPGTTIANIWGFTWDGTREVFHAHRNGQLYHVDPASFLATPLPESSTHAFTDITYSPDHDAIFTVAWVDTEGDYFLVRIDPDTGTPTLVGPTDQGDSIAYDPIEQRLFVVARDGPDREVTAIDPDTGLELPFEAYGLVQAREALAIIPSDSGILDVADHPGIAPSAGPVLQAAPNPMRGTVRLTLSGDVAGGIVSVFDAGGRHVRTLSSPGGEVVVDVGRSRCRRTDHAPRRLPRSSTSPGRDGHGEARARSVNGADRYRTATRRRSGRTRARWPPRSEVEVHGDRIARPRPGLVVGGVDRGGRLSAQEPSHLVAVLVLVGGLFLHPHLEGEAPLPLGEGREAEVVLDVGRLLGGVGLEHGPGFGGGRGEVGPELRRPPQHHDLVGEVLGVADLIAHLLQVHLPDRIVGGALDRRRLHHVPEERGHLTVQLLVESFDELLLRHRGPPGSTSIARSTRDAGPSIRDRRG